MSYVVVFSIVVPVAGRSLIESHCFSTQLREQKRRVCVCVSNPVPKGSEKTNVSVCVNKTGRPPQDPLDNSFWGDATRKAVAEGEEAQAVYRLGISLLKYTPISSHIPNRSRLDMFNSA